MKQFWVYNALRLGVLVATFAVVAGIWLLIAGHLNWVLALIVSFLLSGLISFRLLDQQRAEFAAHIDARARRATETFERMRANEDEDDD